MLVLARVAETFHCRPSELLGYRDQPQVENAQREPLDAVVALQVDVAAAVALWRLRERSGKSEDHIHEERW